MKTIKCLRCGIAVETPTLARKYCEACSAARYEERQAINSAKQKERRGSPNLKTHCERCGCRIKAFHSRQKYCVDCNHAVGVEKAKQII